MKALVKPFLAAALLALASPANAADKLTVLLDWFVNPDHAPLVVAKESGAFARHGLDVELVAPADPSLPPRLVAAGQAEIALHYQPSLDLDVDAGLPLVRFGTLIETPLNTVIVMKDGPIKTLADLKGKKIGYSVSGFEDALLGQILKQSREIHGTQLPTSLNGTTEMRLDTEDLGALSALFANVNKRGFWL